MTRYFFWKGRMPAGITAKSRAGAYKCGTPVADEWLAYPPNQGGFGLWSPMDHLTAVRADWVRQVLSAPDVLPDSSWIALPRHFGTPNSPKTAKWPK